MPELLHGAWDRALFMTYGFEAPFFEGTLWYELGSGCHNRVVLSDGVRFLESCAIYADTGGLVRHLNQRYLGAGIFVSHAAHAKLIMLLSASAGRLLVGSGNLSLQGYARGGELFASYEFDESHPENLNAFLTAREFVQALLTRGYVPAHARQQVDSLWSGLPWLWQPYDGASRPLRHNLDVNFLDQLRTELAGEEVRELTVLSPFFDEKAEALSRLLETFQPARTTVLVQKERTSVNPVALSNLMNRWGDRLEVRPFQVSGNDTYVHAKCYVLKTAERVVCLQGSPNLSQVAMLLTPPAGNVELANLMTGSLGAFDSVFESLKISRPVRRLDGLGLAIQAGEDQTPSEPPSIVLRGGMWQGGIARFDYEGELPAGAEFFILVGERRFPVRTKKNDPGHLEVALPPEVLPLLQFAASVALGWGEDISELSNPIFLCNEQALREAAQSESRPRLLPQFSWVDLGDDILALIDEWSSALIVDRLSLWQAAGKRPAAATSEEDDGPFLDYVDIDYSALKAHPRVAQYHGVGGSAGLLEAMLAGIAREFHEPRAVRLGEPIEQDVAPELDSETEEEAEELEEARRRKREREKNEGQYVQRFVLRCMRGLERENLRALLGPRWVTTNYLYLSHLVGRLLLLGIIDTRFLVGCLTGLWRFFLGGVSGGYLAGLGEDERAWAAGRLSEAHVPPRALAFLYQAARTTRVSGFDKERRDLRDLWRSLTINQPNGPLNLQNLQAAAGYLERLLDVAPSASELLDEIEELLDYETPDGFCRSLESAWKLPLGSCQFALVKLYLGSVRQLEVHRQDLVPPTELYLGVLASWLRYEVRDYYRIDFKRAEQSLAAVQYRPSEDSGSIFLSADMKTHLFKRVDALSQPWDASIVALRRGLASSEAGGEDEHGGDQPGP